VVITSRVAQIGHLRLQGGAGVCRRRDGLRGRGGWPPGQGYAGRTGSCRARGRSGARSSQHAMGSVVQYVT